jgi:hypothetical protein
MEQIYLYAAPFMIKLIKTLATLVPEVVVHWVRGNHGRSGKDFPQEVNFDLLLGMDIKRRFETHPRIKINVYWDFAALIEVDGWLFFLTHGDVVKSWNCIPFYGLVNKGMRWQGSINFNWDFLAHGHFHTAFHFAWNNFTIIGNGCYPTGDDFALQQLGMASLPVQQVFGIHPEHGLTWNYWLSLATKSEALSNVDMDGITLPVEVPPERLQRETPVATSPAKEKKTKRVSNA